MVLGIFGDQFDNGVGLPQILVNRGVKFIMGSFPMALSELGSLFQDEVRGGFQTRRWDPHESIPWRMFMREYLNRNGGLLGTKPHCGAIEGNDTKATCRWDKSLWGMLRPR